MHKVIISANLDKTFRDYTVVRKFSDVNAFELSEIAILIIHDFNETDFDAGVFINKFYKGGVQKFIYMSNNPSMTVKMTISGVKGVSLDEDFYLQDEEELNSLIEDIGYEGDESRASTNANIIVDFVQSFARGDSKIQAPLYLEQVSSAVKELSEIVDKKDYQITVMGESALDVFANASNVIQDMYNKHKDLANKINELQAKINESNNAINKPKLMNTIQHYSTYNYMSTPLVLVVKEYSPCRYLTSFIVAYSQYLHFQKRKRVKVVVLYKESACESSRYSSFKSITEETYKMDTLYGGEFIAISVPRKDVLNKVFNQGSEVFIVIDRMYEKSSLITGRIKQINAVGSIGALERNKVQTKNNVIMSINDDAECLLTLKTIRNYSREFEAQKAMYFQAYGQQFTKIDAILGV